MIKHKSRLKSKQGMGAGYFIMDFKSPVIASEAKPGQFVMLTVNSTCVPLFPRPFSILNTKGDTISLLIKKVGRGTDLLSRLIVGCELDILGPLGNWFPDADRVALIAGGYGIAPFFFLVDQKGKKRNIELYYGGKAAQDILLLSHFEELLGRDRCHITTEDGSMGRKGLVTLPLEERLKTSVHDFTTLMACGPTPMMEAVHHLAREFNIPCYVSMENQMACGYGVCLGCVVPTTGGRVRVCKEGPIIDSRKILWGEP